MIKLKHFFAAVVVCFQLSVAYAASLPTHYPEKFDGSGVIHDIRPNSLTLGDEVYLVSNEVIVHHLEPGRVTGFSSLKLGMNLAFMTTGGNRLVEVWVVPADYDQEFLDSNDD